MAGISSQDQMKVGVAELLVLFVASCLPGQSAWGASFDCRPYFEAKACPETVICATPDLSQLDDVLARRYGYLIKSSSASVVPNLREEQRLWIRQRQSCGCDATCISHLYARRLDELAKPLVGEVSHLVSHWTCTGEGADPRRYALKITEDSYADQQGNRIMREGSIDLVAKNPPSESEGFRIERGVPQRFWIKRIEGGEESACAKYGWTAESQDYDAVFCGATQGVGSLELRPKNSELSVAHIECDSADVE